MPRSNGSTGTGQCRPHPVRFRLYGTTNCHWDNIIPLEPLWAEYKRICKPTAAIVLTAIQPFTHTLITSNPKYSKPPPG